MSYFKICISTASPLKELTAEGRSTLFQIFHGVENAKSWRPVYLENMNN
jgi:hypothetical protein